MTEIVYFLSFLDYNRFFRSSDNSTFALEKQPRNAIARESRRWTRVARSTATLP